MTTKTNTTSRTQVNAAYETSKFSIAFGLSIAVLIGLWGMASLVSALVSNGTMALVKNYLSTVIGM